MHTRNRLWAMLFSVACAGAMPVAQAAVSHPIVPASSLVMTPAIAQINTTINNSDRVALPGTVITAASPRFDRGLVDTSLQLGQLTLMLKRSPEREARAEAYERQLTNPHSPYFHKWLTAQQIGSLFGPSKQDIAKVTDWLTSQGLQVDGIDPTGLRVRFSGNATAVQSAFHTELHNYVVNGVAHFANATPQQIPAALSPVVVGVASLNNFKPAPQMREVGPVHKTAAGIWKATDGKASPLFSNGNGQYDMAPADFNTVYSVNPLWTQTTPVRGAGQTIAVLERTDIQSADVNTFRSAFLPANATGTVTYVQPTGPQTCANPGTNGDESEAALDTEWAGAAAPDANIMVASCADSATDFGPFIAAENILANNVLGVSTPFITIMSLSYGGCEAQQGTAGLAEVNGLWQQAALQGVTVFVSTGDSGAAGCDQNEPFTTAGTAVNGLASTPYNVAVGGTDFYDAGPSGNFANQANYWSPTNAPNGASALGYIPEQTWNDSCASSVLTALAGSLGYSGTQDGESFCNTSFGQQFMSTGGGSGGISSYIAKPTWQYGVYGTRNDGARTLPDVSMFAANGLYEHALIYCMSDASQGGTPCTYSNAGDVQANSAGGTSFAAPAMAGVQALINEQAVIGMGGPAGFTFPWGNVLPVYYDIAMREYGSVQSPNATQLAACNSETTGLAGNGCAFNNITVGDNDEPCLPLSPDCYSRPGHQYGVLSTSKSQLQPAYLSGAGYNYATGLGSVNVSALANAFANEERTYQEGDYAVVSDFLGGAYADFGDGHSDIAYINPSTNTLTELGMVGPTVMLSHTQPVAAGYTIGAMIDVGPLQQGSLASFAFTNPATRQVYLWVNDGNGGRTAYQVGTPYPAGWTLVGSGTVDGSNQGMSALIWQNETTGQVGWWDLTFNGSSTIGVTAHVLSATPGYKLTLADLNGDGFMDFVFTGPQNDVYAWINNCTDSTCFGTGTPSFSHHFVANFPAGWVLQGAGDVNGDGKSDLLFTNNTTHQFGWWLMNGSTVTQKKTVSITPGYQISTIADFNGDGLVDILWTDASGDAYDWQSNGTSFQSFRLIDNTGAVVTLPAGAQVQANLYQGLF
ncbi:VCBS repeat-containing protein [Rhodanobacter sp. 7MK24]|uniref:protease pro-enzyme activation domain-containing protein n=1 Tax=Rhodanobacter sp. 7MK24 TaxID=2775922 RepID=UPI00177D6A39|nr:protease pro-enzyme activation domain-containing protein [Rhodanobacter sp. 7MK24]MBD8881300.1 VCBS repeat-containing protein [Rhodanobacter sp. 7MK24]